MQRYPEVPRGTQKRGAGSSCLRTPGLRDSLPLEDGHGWRRARAASLKGNKSSTFLSGRAIRPRNSALWPGGAGRLLVMPKYHSISHSSTGGKVWRSCSSQKTQSSEQAGTSGHECNGSGSFPHLTLLLLGSSLLKVLPSRGEACPSGGVGR